MSQRYLIQHCLKTGAVIQEIVPTSFNAIANIVLTNRGEFSAVEVSGLFIEAYQADFDQWIAAEKMQDISSRKLRVVRRSNVTAAPPNQSVAPAHMPPVPQAVPSHQQQPALAFNQPTVQQRVPHGGGGVYGFPAAQPAAQAPPVQQPSPAHPQTPSITDTVSVGMQDVLLAIGSLPRNVEPSCSRVLEHLAQHRLPALGVMIEAGLRQCGHSTTWVQEKAVPTRTAPAATAAPLAKVAAVPETNVTFADQLQQAVDRVTDSDLRLLQKAFSGRKTMTKFEVVEKLKALPENNDKEGKRSKLILFAARQRGVIREDKIPDGKTVVNQYTLIPPEARPTPTATAPAIPVVATTSNPAPAKGADSALLNPHEVTNEELGQLMRMFRSESLPLRIRTIRSAFGRMDVFSSPRYQSDSKQALATLLEAAVERGLLKGTGYKDAYYYEYIRVGSIATPGTSEEQQQQGPPERPPPSLGELQAMVLGETAEGSSPVSTASHVKEADVRSLLRLFETDTEISGRALMHKIRNTPGFKHWTSERIQHLIASAVERGLVKGKDPKTLKGMEVFTIYALVSQSPTVASNSENAAPVQSGEVEEGPSHATVHKEQQEGDIRGTPKRSREEQEPHPADSDEMLQERRARLVAPKPAEEVDDGMLRGTLVRWQPNLRGELCGFVQREGTTDRSQTAFVHVKDNPALAAAAKQGDRIRYRLVADSACADEMNAVNAEVMAAK